MSLARIHPRRPKEHLAPGGLTSTCSRATTSTTAGGGGEASRKLAEQLRVALLRFRAASPHCRNTDFRGPLEESVENGFLAAALQVAPPASLQLVAQTQGVACFGNRRSVVEVHCGLSAIEAALRLPGLGECLKPGIIFAAHPADSKEAAACSSEERELLFRTNWGSGFLDDATREGFQAPDLADTPGAAAAAGQGAGCSAAWPHLQAGSPACLLAENLVVLREPSDPSQDELQEIQGPPVCKPLGELAAAVCFQPQHATGCLAPQDRLQYKRQVEAVLKVCALLDLDSLCVGCTEGIAGSDLFGLPLNEVAQVWREVLQDGRTSASSTPLAAQFKRVLFVSSTDKPSARKRLSEVLGVSLGETLLAAPSHTGPKVRGNWPFS